MARVNKIRESLGGLKKKKKRRGAESRLTGGRGRGERSTIDAAHTNRHWFFLFASPLSKKSALVFSFSARSLFLSLSFSGPLTGLSRYKPCARSRPCPRARRPAPSSDKRRRHRRRQRSRLHRRPRPSSRSGTPSSPTSSTPTRSRRPSRSRARPCLRPRRGRTAS